MPVHVELPGWAQSAVVSAGPDRERGPRSSRTNEAKSAVGSALGRKFLGYALWVANGREGQMRGGEEAAAGLQGPHPATQDRLWSGLEYFHLPA